MYKLTVLLITITFFMVLVGCGLWKSEKYKTKMKKALSFLQRYFSYKGLSNNFTVSEDFKKFLNKKKNQITTVINFKNLQKPEQHVILKNANFVFYTLHLIWSTLLVFFWIRSCTAIGIGMFITFISFFSILYMIFLDENYNIFFENKTLLSTILMELYFIFFVELVLFLQAFHIYWL